MPPPGLLHPEPLSLRQATTLQEMLKHSSGSVSVGSLGPGAHKVWGLWASLVGKGFDSKYDFTPPTVLLRISFALRHGVSFYGGIQHSSVNGYSAVSCWTTVNSDSCQIVQVLNVAFFSRSYVWKYTLFAALKRFSLGTWNAMSDMEEGIYNKN